MGAAILVTVVLLLLSIAGVVMAIRSLRGAPRVLLAVTGVLFSMFLLLVLAGEALFVKFGPEIVDYNPLTYQGPTGKIAVPLKGDLTLSLLGTRTGDRMRLMTLKSKEGVFTAPTGEYRLLSCDQIVSHGGAQWRLSSRTERSFSVTPGSSLRLDIGPPYTASIEVGRAEGNRMDLSLKMVGRAGESCAILGGGNSGPPGFQILATTGQVLQQGKFRYG